MIRKARKGDEYRIIELITELAIYEKEPDAVRNTPDKLATDLFEHEYCHAFVAESENKVVGYAIYFTSYSTWNGPCIYLEDLYVQSESRGLGFGAALFDAVLEVAKNCGARRMDWQILSWNKLALDFYKTKGAVIDENWVNGRIFISNDHD